MDSVKEEIIVSLAKYNPSTVILFGSYSRGDYNENSDIDVLEVTQKENKPYSISNINYSTYTNQQLKKMAKSGNLFLLHIILEGKILKGDPAIISNLKKEFNKPENYQLFRKEIKLIAQLLDVTQNNYVVNPKGYYTLLCYLFRSYLYSLMIDSDQIRFSINDVSDFFKDKKIKEVFDLKNKREVSFIEYEKCKKIFEGYADTKFFNKFPDANLLLKNLKENSRFATSVGIHFLKDSLEEMFY